MLAVFDVALPESWEQHVNAAKEWSRIVWNAWSRHHSAIAQFVANRFFSGREFLLPFRWIFTAQSRQACHFLQAPEIKSLLIDSTRWSPVTIYKGRILVIPTCLVNMCPIDQVVMVNVAHAE